MEFTVKLSNLRVYDRPLTLDEIKRAARADETVAHKFTTANPVEFEFYNQDDERVLYITDDDTQLQTLVLDLRNTSPHDIVMQTPDSKPAPVDRNGTTIGRDDWLAGANLYHFQLSFRPGVLSDKAKKYLKHPAYRLAALAEGWDMKYDPDDTDLTDWVSLLWVGKKRGEVLSNTIRDNASPLPLDFQNVLADLKKTPGSVDVSDPKANCLPKQATRKLVIPKMSAGAGGGARGTRVHLNYSHLIYRDRNELVPDGTRTQFVNIINHQGKQYIPLHVGFVGSHSILNDGLTSNELTLRITNISNSETITFKRKPASRFSVSFDVEKDHEKKEWALTKIGEAAAIQIDWALGAKSSKVTASPPKVIGNFHCLGLPNSFYLNKPFEPGLSENSLLMIVKRQGRRILRSSLAVVSSTSSGNELFPQIFCQKPPTTAKEHDSVELVSHVKEANTDWRPDIDLQGERLCWSFTYTGNSERTLGPGQGIEFKLSEIKSSSPTGYTNLYLHYEDIPGYWDGQFTCLIEKAPLVYRRGDVGIGTDMEAVNYSNNPIPKLHVNVSNDNANLDPKKKKPAAVFEGGNVGIGTKIPKSTLSVSGGAAIGPDYANDSAAPKDGLVVEGNTGIGTQTPNSALSVSGGAAIGSGYAADSPAPPNGLIIEGKVGIGTKTPKSELSVSGGLTVSGGIAIGDKPAPANGLIVDGSVVIRTDTPGGLLHVENVKGAYFEVRNDASYETTQLVGVFHGVNAGAQMRFSGVKQRFIDIGQNAEGNFVIECDDQPQLLVKKEGGVTVKGELMIGSSHAVAAEEKLRIVRGFIDKNSPNGTGYTFSNPKITFAPAFSGRPTVIVSAPEYRVNVKEINCDSVDVYGRHCHDGARDIMEHGFGFIAIGPR